MRSREYERRLDRLEQHTSGPVLGRIVTIEPGLWPRHVREAYEAASVEGDHEQTDDIVEAQTGERPTRMAGCISIIEIVVDPESSGPFVEIDPDLIA